MSSRQHSASPEISDTDRLSFTLFIALAAHAVLILGLGFTTVLPAPMQALEVTLAFHSSKDAPAEADYLAQHNQLGSGSLDQKAELATSHHSDFHNDAAQNVQLKRMSAPAPVKADTQRSIITATVAQTNQPLARQNKHQYQLPHSDQLQLQQQLEEISSLEAKLKNLEQNYAKRPRIRQVTSVSAKAHRDALYIETFRVRVEQMATRHFPSQALSHKQFGKVRLLVSINKDGSLHEMRILSSSGFPILDESALQSIRLSAPFPSFPPEMARDLDRLEIIRTWKFDAQQMVSSNF